jgi:anti-sigma B factor antagonist
MVASKFDVQVVEDSRWNGAILNASGVLDAESAPVFEATLRELYDKKVFNIIVNLEEVEFISSAGWGVFTGDLKFARENGGDIKLAHLRPEVLEIFLLLELDHFISYYDTVTEALGHARVVEPARSGTAVQSESPPDSTEAEAAVPVSSTESTPPEVAQFSSAERLDEPAEEMMPSDVTPPSADLDLEAFSHGEAEADEAPENGTDNGSAPRRGEVDGFRLGRSSKPHISQTPAPNRVDSVNGSELAGGKWGLWRHIFRRRASRRETLVRREVTVAWDSASARSARIDWTARRGRSGGNSSPSQVEEGHHTAGGVRASVVADESPNGSEDQLARLKDGETIAAVIRENPLLGPARIKRRLDELAGGDCKLSVTTIYRRLRSARLNTRERRVHAFANREERVS